MLVVEKIYFMSCWLNIYDLIIKLFVMGPMHLHLIPNKHPIRTKWAWPKEGNEAFTLEAEKMKIIIKYTSFTCTWVQKQLNHALRFNRILQSF